MPAPLIKGPNSALQNARMLAMTDVLRLDVDPFIAQLDATRLNQNFLNFSLRNLGEGDGRECDRDIEETVTKK